MKVISKINNTIILNDKLPLVYFMESTESVKVELNNCDKSQDNRVPVTGPIYINNTTKNDALKITIEKIDASISNLSLGFIALAMPSKNIDTSTFGNNGGLLELTDIKENAVIFLPVFVDGGYLFLGDLFLNSENEKITTDGVMQIKVEVVKNFKIAGPIVILNDKISFLRVCRNEKEVKNLINYVIDYLVNIEDISKDIAIKITKDKYELIKEAINKKLYKITLQYIEDLKTFI